jgi:deaminated glutathione amidase
VNVFAHFVSLLHAGNDKFCATGIRHAFLSHIPTPTLLTHTIRCEGCLGVTICYDLRFPEMYTELVQTMGAQVLLVPSAFTVPTGRAHWHTLLRGTWVYIWMQLCSGVLQVTSDTQAVAPPMRHSLARAIENQCYVIAAAQYGSHNDKRESYGHALVVDPWGAIVVDAGGADTATTVNDQAQQAKGGDDIVPLISTPSIVTCVIDLNLVSSIRERMPIQQHRTNAQF